MDKKVDIKKNDNRSELVGKVNIKEDTKKKTTAKKEKKVNLEETIALDTVEIMRKGNVKKHSEEEKRSHIAGKFSNKKKSVKKRTSSRTPRVDMTETTDDKFQENVENVSVVMIICIILICFVVGGALGYILYDIAINNSDSISMLADVVNKIWQIYM